MQSQCVRCGTPCVLPRRSHVFSRNIARHAVRCRTGVRCVAASGAQHARKDSGENSDSEDGASTPAQVRTLWLKHKTECLLVVARLRVRACVALLLCTLKVAQSGGGSRQP
jgi:hypothetical protein